MPATAVQRAPRSPQRLARHQSTSTLYQGSSNASPVPYQRRPFKYAQDTTSFCCITFSRLVAVALALLFKLLPSALQWTRWYVPPKPPAKPDISYCSRSDPVVLCALRRLHVRCARVVRPTVARRQLHLLLPSRKAVPPRLSMQVDLRMLLLPSGPRWQVQHPPQPRPLVLQRHPHSLLRLPRQSPDPFRFPMLDGPGPMIRTMICPAPLPLLIAHRIRQLSARRNG